MVPRHDESSDDLVRRFWWEDIFDDFRGCGRKLAASDSESES